MQAPDEAKAKAFISTWETDVKPKIEANREIVRVDVKVEELVRRGELTEDETFIGTKVVGTNIRRELPRAYTFLTESSRFLIVPDEQDVTLAKGFEEWYASKSREGTWLIPHLQAYFGGATHGIGFVEVIADKESTLGTKVDYVPNNELLYVGRIKDIQVAGLVARLYRMPVSFVRTFGDERKFDESVIKELEEKNPDKLYENEACLYKFFYRRPADNIVMCRWYCNEVSKWISPEYPHVAGAAAEDGTVLTTKEYPFVPIIYTISADTAYCDLQGRAADDESLQEGIQGITTAIVNGYMRASGFYPCLANSETDQGAEVKFLDGVALKHGKIAKAKLDMFQPAWPSPEGLSLVQSMRATASNDAGQTDFATTSKKVANTTATEIAASEKQASLLSSIGIAMLATHMYLVEKMRFEIFRKNTWMHKNVPAQFLPLLMRAKVRSIIDQQFKSRDEKLSTAVAWLDKLQGTGAYMPLLKEIIKEAVPQYAQLIIDNLSDVTPVGQAMLALLEQVAQTVPELGQNEHYAQILNAARSTFGAPRGSGGASSNVASQPNNAGASQEPQSAG